MLGLSGTSSYAVFVYLCVCVFCICIFIFVCSAPGNISFDILEQSSFQKYITCWVFLTLCHMLYLCIRIRYYSNNLRICIRIWTKVAFRMVFVFVFGKISEPE